MAKTLDGRRSGAEDRQDLESVIAELHRRSDGVESSVSSVAASLAGTSASVAPTPEAWEAARGKLLEAQENLARGKDAVEAVTGLARRYRQDIDLVGSIMSAERHVDEGMEAAFLEFTALLAEYLDVSREDNYPAEADAYRDLMVVRTKMARLRFAPRLARKHIVAVAGGFSSGKSSFINRMIGDDCRLLPTQLTPTTSIPTYVHRVPDGPVEIATFNADGGKETIDEERLRAMTHDFEKEYRVSLKRIVDRIVVSTPDMAGWNRIAFVDTPGYTNPEGEQVDRRDTDLTLNEVLSAHYLVWLVDAENGTLRANDVDYIRRFLDRDRDASVVAQGKAGGNLYIVVSKADKKPAEQRSEILNEVAEAARKAGIPCAGVATYSARTGEWYEVQGERFDTFLDVVNGRQRDLGLAAEVDAVLQRYIDYHRGEAQACTRHVGFLKRVGMRVDGDTERPGQLSVDLSSVRASAEGQAARHAEHEARYRSLCSRFEDAFKRFQALMADFGDTVERSGTGGTTEAQARVAEALVNRGVKHGELGDREAEIADYDDAVERFGASEVPAVQPYLAAAMAGRGGACTPSAVILMRR